MSALTSTARPESKGSIPDRVWVSSGLTINLGNYESVRLEAGMSSDLRPGENPQTGYKRITVEVDRKLDEESARWRKQAR